MTGRTVSHRRRFLYSVGAAVAVAGCLDDSSDDDTDNAGADDEDRTVDHDEFPSHSGGSPREFPGDHICNGVCGMAVADFPDWNAQLAHDNDRGAFFCTSGCLISYLVAPDHVGALESAVTDVWVRDFETGALIDGTEAHYVVDPDDDRLDEPMGLNPRPFADRADAVAFTANDQALDDSDVIGLDEFDLETAMVFREYQLRAAEE